MFVGWSLLSDRCNNGSLLYIYNDVPFELELRHDYPLFCLHRSRSTVLSLVCSFATIWLACFARHQIEFVRSTASTQSLRTRCRIQGLYHQALEMRHVPFIIEYLLPTLIAMSLTCFFVGFIASTYYGFAFAAMFVASALSVGISLSLLPIFHPDCAYKTPLTHHCFAMLNSPSSQRFMDIFSLRAYIPFQFDSLHHVEVEMTRSEPETLDVSVLHWLFNDGKSSQSVKAIMLQALSSLPLESIPLFSSHVVTPYIISSNTILQAIQDDFDSSPVQTPDRFSRLQRAALRFESGASHRVRTLHMQYGYNVESRYTFYRQEDYAQQLVTGNLLYHASHLETNFDAILWAKIFAYAIESDPSLEWLCIDNIRPSEVWAELLRCALSPRSCEIYEGAALLTFKLPEGMPALEIDHYDRETELDNGMEEERRNSSPRLASILSTNMRPSFLRWLIHVGFSHVKRDAHMKNVPDDVFLLLAMLQTLSIQKTSTLSPPIVQEFTLFRDILLIVTKYLVERCHMGTDKTTLIVLQQVIESDSFGSHTVISLGDQCFMLQSVFVTLRHRFRNYGPDDELQVLAHQWLTPEITSKILTVALQHPTNAVSAIWRILSYFLCYPRSSRHVKCLERVYTSLLERSWLQGMARTFTAGWKESPLQADGGVQPITDFSGLHTGCLAALYIDGLKIVSPDIYRRVVDDLSDADNPSTICKMLLLSNKQSRMWEVARIIDGRTDGNWIRDLVEFSTSDQVKDMSSDYVGNGYLHRITTALMHDVIGKHDAPSYVTFPLYNS